MFYTGLDPRDMSPVYVPRDPHEKAMQRALMQYFRPENHALVLEALRRAGREDLIGFGKECLVPPRLIRREGKGKKDARSAPGKPKEATRRGGRPKDAPRKGSRSETSAQRNGRPESPAAPKPKKKRPAKPSPTGKRRV